VDKQAAEMKLSEVADAKASALTMPVKTCVYEPLPLHRLLGQPPEKFRGMNQRQRRKRERRGGG
jgi:hypothetical protein